MVDGHLPFVFEKFRLHSEPESVMDVDIAVAEIVKKESGIEGLQRRDKSMLVVVTNSPNVMRLARKLFDR